MFYAPVQTDPGAHPASCTIGTGAFPGGKSGRGVTLTPHPLLVPWSWKVRSILLLPLWVIRPVQSLSVCTRVHFTLPYLHQYTGLFISPCGISELSCATTKTDTAERNISIGRESLQVFFCTRGLGVLPRSTARG